MVTGTVVQGAPELTEDYARFLTRSNLADQIRAYDRGLAAGDFYADAAAHFAALKRPGQRRAIDGEAGKLLRLAWQHELGARVGSLYDDSTLRLATMQTLPVQVYYAVFSAGRSFTRIAGAPVDRHAVLRKVFATQHVHSAHGSFGVTLTGDPVRADTCVLSPPICRPDGFNTLERDHEPEEYVWAALRWAREHQVADRRKEWLKDPSHRTRAGRPYKALPSARRAELINAERPTSMLDYLYELRCSTNYRHIDEYTGELESPPVDRFHDGMLHLLEAGLLTYEGQIARYTGTGALKLEFEEWGKKNRALGAWATDRGEARLDALAAAGL